MESIIKKALELQEVEYLDIRLEETTITQVVFNGNELENAGTVKKKGGCVRAYHKGNFGFATFNRVEEIEKAVKEAQRLAKLSEAKESEFTLLKPVKDVIRPKVKDDPRNHSLEEKVELARNYNEIILKGNDKIQSSNVKYEDRHVKIYFYSTEGTELDIERIYCGISFVSYARDGSNVQWAFNSFGDQRGFQTVLNHETDVEEVVKHSLDLLKAEKVEGGVYTVILDPRIAGTFIHEAFGHLSEADHMARNEKLKALMKPGTRFGPDFLNVIDDGSLEGERGYIGYDDEGVKARKTYLIKEGILVGRLHSRQTAALMGEEVTGNARALDFRFMPIVRMTNTYIDRGDKDFEELLEGIDKGLYVIGALGGQTELEMFTFSAERAYLIEKGKIGKMVRDVVLSGNVFETLKNIEAIGKDLTFHGGLGGCGKAGQSPLPVSTGSPHIRIKNVVIGGR